AAARIGVQASHWATARRRAQMRGGSNVAQCEACTPMGRGRSANLGCGNGGGAGGGAPGGGGGGGRGGGPPRRAAPERRGRRWGRGGFKFCPVRASDGAWTVAALSLLGRASGSSS